MRSRPLVLLLTSLSLVAAGFSGAGADESRQMAVRLEPGGLARAGVDASFAASYGSFDWAVVDARDLDALRSSGVAFEAHPEAGRLVLPAASFDPLAALPDVAAAELEPSRPSLHLVQFHGPIKDAWLDALSGAGALLVQYIAPFSYAVLLAPEDAGNVSSLAPVRWVGAFEPAYRFANLDLEGAALANLVVLDDGRAGSVLGALERAGGSPNVTGRIPFSELDAVGVQAAASPAVIAAAAAMPSVYSISAQRAPAPRDEMSDQIIAGNYTAAGVPQPGYRDWLNQVGANGKGVIVAHVDTGVSARHPDLAGQLGGCRDYTTGDVGALCIAEMTDTFGHGTHTAGIILGTGATGLEGTDGFEYGLGVAPGAKLFGQNYVALVTPFAPTGPGQYIELNRHSVLGGATVSANSWGPAGDPQGYDADTREFDFAPRDANLVTPQHEPLDFVLSIMNGEGGTSTQGSPDEGKNLLRVGATENLRFTGADIDDLSFVSAHGPALDGRRLPDVVAPGEAVISTADPVTTALCLDPVIGTGILLYSHCTGTSMASPHVSGGSAIFIEHYRDRFGRTPSPALIKAAFVNGAVDLAGALDASGDVMGHYPDDKQGWGRFNLRNVIQGTTKTYLDQTVLLTDTGSRRRIRVKPVDAKLPVKITLVWTDAPGPGLGGATPAWVNDLDLRVTAGGVQYLGNSFGSPSTGWSVPGGTADFMNNVENVYLQSASGVIDIDVIAANLAGDGVPGRGDFTDQDFALVLSNARSNR